MSGFVFATCQPGAERWLKADVARIRADARPAFMRPGLVTFKVDEPTTDPLPTPFARVSGRSLGRAGDVAGVVALIPQDEPIRLHVWGHDDAERIRGELLATGRFLADPQAVRDEDVLDVVVDEKKPTEWLVGLHRNGPSPWPGGGFPIDIPADAPSKAYAKLEEAIAWQRLDPRAGEIVFEIGCSPGGATLALLRRGLTVIGVDPEPVAPVIDADPRFKRIASAIGAVKREDLPEHVDWLVCDASTPAPIAVRALQRLWGPLRAAGLRGAIVTLKLNDDKVAAGLPGLLDELKKHGLRRVACRQLVANGQEVIVVARR